MNARRLKVLMVGGSADDADLVKRALERGGYELDLEQTDSEPGVKEALHRGNLDLVITDHRLFGFDSSAVLKLIAEISPGLPCILVSGQVGEEAVGEFMRHGAVDFVAKENLDRLPAVVDRAVAARERTKLKDRSELALADSGRLFEAVFLNAGDAMAIFDQDRRLLDANPAAVALLGISLESLTERRIEDFLADSAIDDMAEPWEKFLLAKGRRGEIEVRGANNEIIQTEFTVATDFIPGRHLIVLRDIRESRRSQARAKQLSSQQETIAGLGKLALRGTPIEELFDEAVLRIAETMDAAMVAVLELDHDGGSFIVRASEGIPGLERGTHAPYEPPDGSLASYAVGREEAVLVTDFDLERRFKESTILTKEHMRSALSVQIDGPNRPFGILGSAAPRPGAFDVDDGAFFHAVANLLADAVRRVKREDEMRDHALHDPLTGLANRTLFLDRLANGLSRADRAGNRLAVVSLDLDAFKSMNDTFGHIAGDQMLIEVARRIEGTIRDGDTVARFGGDEFVMMYEGVADENEAGVLADRLLDVLRKPFTIEGSQCAMNASLGVALSDSENHDVEALLRDADIALYLSKDGGRSTWTIATESIREDVTNRAKIKQALDLAIHSDQIYLDYQPIVVLATGELHGTEALARWNHPERGLIPPEVFIPIAEESGVILKLGDWVLREACAQAVRWRTEFGEGAPLPIHVNVSARQVAQLDLVESVRSVLAESGADPSDIALEITETVLIGNFSGTMEILSDLRLMGVKVVLDDFGTGYSSLSYLDRFPIDTLKIDRSFMSPLGNFEDPLPVVAAILSMAKAMKILSVAEGVETADQVALMIELGCEFGQGSYFGKPGSPDLISGLVLNDSYLRDRADQAAEISSLGVTGS